MNRWHLHHRLSDRTLRLRFLIIFCFLAACASRCTIIPTEPSPKDPIQEFRQEIERLSRELRIPGLSAAVLHQKQVVFAEGFGYAHIENKIPATVNTPYNIASLTKPFAATVLMKLVEESQLDLDDDMADILKDTLFPFRFRGDTIHGYASACKTIRRIGRNRDFPFAFLFQNYHCDTERITVRHHLTHTAQGVPGETYRYNGFLYGLLSLVAEEVSGRNFEELLVENIIGPLEMTRTVPSIGENHRSQVLAGLTKYYRKDSLGHFVISEWPSKDVLESLKMSGVELSMGLNAGGGMISTVLDLAKFDVAMDQNLIVSEESKEAMFTPTVSSSGKSLPYGLGWFVQEHRGVKIIWHYGWAPDAYSSLIVKVPEEEVTLILLANSDGASARFNLGEGDVLKSPFAVAFVKLFTKMEVTLQ